MDSYFSIVFLLTFRVFCSDTCCTLILLSPKYSMATYFDPDRQSNVDYTNVKKVLDDVLPGYAQSGGTFTRPIRKYGKHVFSHNTTFCCVKQPPGGQKGAYYAIHHMRAIVRDHHQLLLPSKLKELGRERVGNPGRGHQTRILSHPVGVCGNHPSRCPSYLGAALPQESTVEQ